MDIQPNAQGKKFDLTPLSPKDFELAPVTAEAFMPENIGGITPDEPGIEAPDRTLLQDFGAGIKKGWLQAKSGIGGLVSEVAPASITGSVLNPVFNPVSVMGWADDVKTKAIENKKQAEAIKGKGIVFEAGTFVPQMAGTVGALLAAPFTGGTSMAAVPALIGGANLGFLTSQVVGNSLLDIEEYAQANNKEISDLTKWSVALLSGAAEFAAEKIRLDRILPKGMTSKMLTTFLKEKPGVAEDLMKGWAKKNPSLYKKFIEVVKTTGKQGFEEGTEEFFTQIAQDYANYLYQNPDDRLDLKQILSNSVDAFKGGAMMGGFLGPITTASKATERALRQNKNGITLVQDGNNNTFELIGISGKDAFVQDQLMNQKKISADDIKDKVTLSKEQMDEYLDAYKNSQDLLPQLEQKARAQSDPDAPIKAEINQYGEKLKFNSNVPLAEDQNPLISIASHKIEDKKFFLTGESGAIGDHVFTAYDFDALHEAGYDLTQVRPQLIKASDIRERMDIPYQEWLQQEVNQFKQAQAQGQREVIKSQAPVQEGQEITLKDKQFVVTAVDETGVTLNEMDKDGNITGATLPIPPEDYEKVFGAPAVDPNVSDISDVSDPVETSETGEPAAEVTAEPAEVQLPVNKKGEIEYDQITEPKIYAQGLTQEFGTDAQMILDKLIAKQNKALAKAENLDDPIESARKVKAINAELTKLTHVKNILNPPTATATQAPGLEAQSASPVVEQPDPIEQATEQELARPDFEKTQKYTLNLKNNDLPQAPKISTDDIDWIESGLEDGLSESFGDIKSIKLLESRGRNMNGRLVGTIRVVGTEGAETFEVFFNESKQELTRPEEEEKEELTPASLSVVDETDNSQEELNVLMMLKESTNLTSDEKKILYRQYKNGVMSEEEIAKYTLINVADLQSGKLDKWARAILQSQKSSKVEAEEIDFEEIQQPAKEIKIPEVVYHGSPYGKVSKFDKGELINASGAFFFTSDKEVAKTFAEQQVGGESIRDPQITQARINITNPAIYNGNVEDEVTIDQLFEGMGLDVRDIPLELQGEQGQDEYPVWKWYTEEASIFEKLQELGYDGFISKEKGHEVYAVFSADQISVQKETQPATEKSPEVELTKANAQVDTRPTDAQKEAGNYQKGHLKFHGLDISIESPVGSIRKGTDKKGNDWAIVLNNSYGYIRRTISPEGNDQVDVFLGDNLDSDSVYVIDQIDPDSGKFDEHKVMIGFNSAQDAKDNYLANYEPGWKGLGAITAMPLDEFKQWVYDREKTSRPVDAKVPVKGGEKADNGVAQWVDAFNKAKENNDLNAIQDIYDKVSIYINGPAQKYGEQVVNDLTQLRGQIEAYAEEARKSNQKAKPDFAGEALDNAPKTRSLREFTKGDHVKNVKTGNEYVVISVPKTGDVSLKKLKGKEIQNFNGKSAQWIPIQREIKTKGAKRTVKFSPDSQKGKLLARMPQTFKEYVLQFFVRGGRVSHADFFRHVGWKAGKKEGYVWAVKGSADGTKEQGKAFDSFWEGTPEEWERRGGMEDTIEIVDILKTYPSITQMMAELKRLQSQDESVPDRNIPSQEELDKAISDADIEDDLENHEDEIVGTYDDMWDNPDYQIIFDKYSTDKGLDVDKLLADINDNPGEISILTPFGLNDKELNTLKKYLEDEQSRRKESQRTESIQGLDQDKGPDRKEDSPGSGQGDTVRTGPDQGREGEGKEVAPPKDDIDKINDILDKPAEPKKGPSYSPIQQKQIDKINKEYSELIAKKEAAIVQAEKDMREALLKADNRNGLFGDTNPVEKDEIIKRDEQGFTYDEATRAAVRKPFEEKMAELRKEIEELRLEQKGKINFVTQQQDLFADTPAEPAESKPIDKESLPKHEDFGQKIGGARKDMEITRKVRDTDSLPAWRRKYHYANANGTMTIGEPVDTSKPFIVQWSKEIASWGGKRTIYRPVTTIDTRETKIFNSEEEAEAYIPIYEVWNQHFRVRKSGDNYVITKTSSTNKVVEYATFPTEEEANTYMYSTEGATSLLNHKREDFSIPALDKVERTGKDWRNGKDISTEEFMETFGFRGGEFGNWVKPEERRVMLNAAYDSFMDLAELLGVPPRSLSLSGELSIAFGARGVKGAAAHFEPDRAVINLTRMNGAGSLAHEWAHALDNYFGLQAAKKDYSRNDKGEVKAGKVMRTTADLLSVRGMRKELSEIFDKIIEATQEKSVTRKMGIDEKQKYFDKFQKSVKREADDLVKKFENGVRRYQYNRKTKQREDVVIKGTPEQIKKARELTSKITAGEGARPTWDRIPESKSRFGEYSYISPEMLALDELHKAVFGKTGLKRDGAGFYNLGYYSDRMYGAKETLDKALAGESETLNVPTDFLKVSREFDKSRAKPYWGTKIEMFARAFEYFIETKLQDQNVRADYLQYDKAPVYDAVYGKNPYPQGDERAEINKLFQQFFDEVKVKTDENNVTLLYEKAEEYIRENKVYSQARPQQDFPEGVSYLSERASGALSGQLNLFGESDYTPTADDGNVTYVERLISERGITFLGDKLTGPPTIRTSADIAFLFKNLESATSENAFAVLISETGEYKVLYLGTGGTTGVIIDSKLILAAAKDFGAKRVVVVHNHPSGNLKPSGADMAFDTNINSALASMGIDLDPSIIIDLDSGEFTVFAGENVDYKKYRKEDYGTDVPVEDKTIYQFEKKKLYVPASERTAVKNSADIAEYLSKMKRGTTPKLHVMILDRSLHINKYLLYDETISNEELISGLLYEVGKHGEMVALASNTRMSPGLLVDLAAKLKKVDSNIIDFIQIKQGDDIINNYMSYADEGYLSESKVSYGSTESSRERQPEFAGEYLERAQDITQTPAFKKWFGNSKVVDENGKPLVVYHGTIKDFDEFDKDKIGTNSGNFGFIGKGFYFTPDQGIASAYGKLMPVYLSLQNPFDLTKPLSKKDAEILNDVSETGAFEEGNTPDDVYNGFSYSIPEYPEIAEAISNGLKAFGYDGVILKGRDKNEIVVFSPTQIKSTGNKGTFDPENPNILEEPQDNYRFAGDWLEEQPDAGPNPDLLKSAAEIYAERQAKGSISETVQGIREYIQDMNLPVRKFEEDVLKRGGRQDNNSKPYRDMNLSFGRQEKLYTDYFDKKMKPIFRAIAAIKKAGVKGEEILPYVIAKHAIERNPIMRGEALRAWVDGHQDATADEIDAKREELKDLDYSGVKSFDGKNEYENPDALARDIVKAFESTIDKSLIDNFWNSVRTATSATLDTWEAGNQISAEQKKKYLEQYRFFVPLRGWRHGAAKELIYTRGEGFSKSLQKAEGRKSLADNPLAYILSVQFQAIAEQVDNEVKTSMYNLILKNLKNPEINDLATIKKLYYVKIKHSDGTEEWEPTEQRPDQELFASGDAKTKIYREHERLRKFRHAKEHEVIVHKPGGDMIIVFKKNQLSTAHALNKQNYIYRTVFGNIYDARDVNKALALLGSMNNTLKALYTSWNVVFPFTNFMRDFQEASITQSIKQGTGLKVMANYKGAFPAVFRNLIGKPNLNSQMDRDLQDFYSLGGATGYTHTKTIEDIEKDVNREVERLVGKGTVLGSMKNGFQGTMGAVEAWNKVFEDATRFSVYLSSLAAGNSKQDAAMDAKEASVNFNRKGKGSKAWDSWFAFFNVALQSLQKNFKLAKDHTGKFTAVAGSFVMLGFLEALMNALTDDDDKDSAYYNINPWMRQNYLIIPNLPKILTTGEKGNKYLSIPLPQFWRGFKSIGAIAFDIATKKMTIGDGVMAALGNFGSGLLPVDIGGFYKSGEFSWAPVFPTVLKPIVEVAENKNYMGYAIKNEPFTREQKKDLANAGLGKTNVSPAAKYLTDMLFRWGGGKGKYKYYYDHEKGERRNVPGVLDINPSAIEHIFKGYTGGTGAGLSDLFTTVIQATSPDQDIDFKNVPFVNRFIRTVPEAKWNIISEYYNLRDDERANSKLEKEAVKDAETTGDWSTVTAMYGNEYLQRYQETFASFENELDDAMKMKDFDIVEGNRLSVEIMERAISEIKELKREYGKK